MLLGCIGDDFTGSSDLANTLRKEGMGVRLFSGVPDGPAADGIDAGVVALKSRTIPVAEAVAQSRAALRWLRDQGCTQFLFKYCSTFDSTPEGNIGPVAAALAEDLGETRVIICPAFPATGRSVYQGHLFVGDMLLSDSGMRHHPLTPMTDSDIRRWLAQQTDWAVDHIGAATVFDGADAIRAALGGGSRAMVVVDAIRDADLRAIGRAARDRTLITGGSGIALGLPDNFRDAGTLSATEPDWQGAKGRALLLSGSCSEQTRRQVAAAKASGPAYEVTAEAVMGGEATAARLLGWAEDSNAPAPLIYSSADPAVVKAAQEKFGRDTVASAIEALFGDLAVAWRDAGHRIIVTAGGETSGAVVEALKLDRLDIGPEIAAGVPAVRDPDSGLCLALKSGNFGQDDFFARAVGVLTA
ncbi:3-oxo-tetronate kinase [Oceanomicrobium pacificus]|uniref:3-oxo-tetronate kinase n=1 Tax=Oceanomicrobium pacificus TaxID=2692916 RepID=A0A6B0TYY9_9RHOB|nr:3-oxo-tetronate kinase [Oceanomicrobium pacificus]MXU66628.1 hypothetical protein [Oceanomicrobium pacificus]